MCVKAYFFPLFSFISQFSSFGYPQQSPPSLLAPYTSSLLSFSPFLQLSRLPETVQCLEAFKNHLVRAIPICTLADAVRTPSSSLCRLTCFTPMLLSLFLGERTRRRFFLFQLVRKTQTLEQNFVHLQTLKKRRGTNAEQVTKISGNIIAPASPFAHGLL